MRRKRGIVGIGSAVPSTIVRKIARGVRIFLLKGHVEWLYVVHREDCRMLLLLVCRCGWGFTSWIGSEVQYLSKHA